jgi:NAD-dependent dihydropyrimidine dehydrogenase PreA subunit
MTKLSIFYGSFKNDTSNFLVISNKNRRVKNMPATVNADECSGCGSCVDECPSEAITLDEEKGCAVIDNDECVECGACEEACPNQAIKVEE